MYAEYRYDFKYNEEAVIQLVPYLARMKQFSTPVASLLALMKCCEAITGLEACTMMCLLAFQ
jgi:hypothetical protein